MPRKTTFKRGYIFEELQSQAKRDLHPLRLRVNIQAERESLREEGTWNVINTPLQRYVRTLGFHFDAYLLKKIQERKATGSSIPIKVLDVGIGTGKQWLDFLKTYNLELGKDIELHGT